MSVHFTPEQEERLQELASKTGRTPDEIANEAISSFLEYQAALAADIREGEDSAERDGWIDHDEVVRRINGRLLKTA